MIYLHVQQIHISRIPQTCYISVASADKGQARNSQSAPGPVLIKEQVAAPSVHSGFGQEKEDEEDWQREGGWEQQ